MATILHRRLIAVVAAAAFVAVGCEANPKRDGDRPGVIVPSGANSVEEGGRGKNSGALNVGVSAGDRVLADVQGVKVTETQVLPILLEAHGLDVLLKVVQLNMAREVAGRMGITLSPADVDRELTHTLQLAFPEQKPEDYDELLRQLLGQQRISRPEFDVIMQTNAYLRAIVRDASMRDISEEVIRNEFNALYGERVLVRHIALNNLQEVAEAQARLRGKPATATTPSVPPEPFEKVAREMSQARVDRENGGLMEPFARTTAGVDAIFVQAAFALKTPGEVSPDAIQVNEYYHLIKLEQRLPPQHQKFEDVRDSVREELIRRRQNVLMAERRRELAQIALQDLKINEPLMKQDFESRRQAATPKPPERDEIRRNLDAQRDRLNRESPPKPATTMPTLNTDPAKTAPAAPTTETSAP